MPLSSADSARCSQSCLSLAAPRRGGEGRRAGVLTGLAVGLILRTIAVVEGLARRGVLSG
jgi:hypothetical protein